MKTKKYLLVIKKYTIKKREPDIKVIDIVDTEEEAIKHCTKNYSDYIEVWAEYWPQDTLYNKIAKHMKEKEW